jgi:DNA-binding transcriptional MerR regulator/methylmalonyl-CoA mutase cobalamin-binding subunit
MPSVSIDSIPIRSVAAITGVKPLTLRAWERRYGLIRPLRSAKGHRLYTHEHVELIRRVVALVQQGVPIGQVSQQLAARPTLQTGAKPANHWADCRRRMLIAITRFDEPGLDELYEEILSLHPIESLTREVILPTLRDLGERWHDLPGAIAEEHFFATYLRSKLGARLQQRARYAQGPRLVIACAPGEHHEIGALLLALEARSAGFRVVLLGADTPLADIAVAARRCRADAVALSSSVGPLPGLLEDDLPSLVRNPGLPVFVGGATALRHRDAVSSAGAIALGTDLEDAVRMIRARLDRTGARA